MHTEAETIKRMRESIAYAVENKCELNDASFGYEEGVLVSVNEAISLTELPVKYCNWYLKEGNSWAKKQETFPSDEKIFEHFLSLQQAKL